MGGKVGNGIHTAGIVLTRQRITLSGASIGLLSILYCTVLGRTGQLFQEVGFHWRLKGVSCMSSCEVSSSRIASGGLSGGGVSAETK